MLADLVQKPAVVRDHQERALALGPAGLEVVRQPFDGLHVKVVGGLVHAYDVPGAHEQAGQVAAAALATGELAHQAAPVKVPYELVHDAADARVGGPDVVGGLAHHGVPDRLVIAELVGLAEVANVDAAAPGDRALVGLQALGHDVQQR